MPDTEPQSVPPGAWIEFERALRRYLRRRVDPGLVDDLLSDILLRLVQHQANLAKAENPLAWVRRVAANAVTDLHRSRGVERRAVDSAKAEHAIAMAEIPGSTAAAEISACLIPFIRELRDPYRDALLLTDIAGLRQTEAARRLGLSHSGMKSRVQRARAKLKARLLRCCAIQTDRRGAIVDYMPHDSRCQPACASPTKSDVATAAGQRVEYSPHLHNGGP